MSRSRAIKIDESMELLNRGKNWGLGSIIVSRKPENCGGDVDGGREDGDEVESHLPQHCESAEALPHRHAHNNGDRLLPPRRHLLPLPPPPLAGRSTEQHYFRR
ncbi:hypothetical protein KSP39_PZI020840 [Platanthera zijinensis]|uniref:Uncharacterized protein n=1 Tax=Platanthera zijinensis TaxID=2320716 RepID=A0AAP0FWW6_9ASPA